MVCAHCEPVAYRPPQNVIGWRERHDGLVANLRRSAYSVLQCARNLLAVATYLIWVAGEF